MDFKQASTCRDKGVCSNDFVFIKKIELVLPNQRHLIMRPVKGFLATMQFIFWQTNTNNQSDTQQQKLQKINLNKQIMNAWTSNNFWKWPSDVNSNRQDYLQAILCTCIFRLLDTAMVSELLLECKHFRFSATWRQKTTHLALWKKWMKINRVIEARCYK